MTPFKKGGQATDPQEEKGKTEDMMGSQYEANEEDTDMGRLDEKEDEKDDDMMHT